MSVRVVTHHFSTYDSLQGSLVEAYLRGEFGDPKNLSPYFVNSLYAIDRAVTWEKELKDEYESGSTILLDRYTTSSIIYQASIIPNMDERKEFIKNVINYEYYQLGIGEPDQVLFLTAPFDLVTRLRNKRKENDGIEADIHESDLAFMKSVYENALLVADLLNWDKVVCNNGKKFKSIDTISDEVYKLVKKNK